jgi:superfamily II DNA or RNA helicase
MPTRHRRDVAALSLLVDPETTRRGDRYAAQGSVVDWEWVVPERKLWGKVTGTARSPYTAFVTLDRDRTGGLTRFQGTCTCPMKADCKHTVALLLTADDADADGYAIEWSGPTGLAEHSLGTIERPAAEPVRPWELSLRGLLEPDSPAADVPLALQFEIVDPRLNRSPRTGVQRSGRVAMRPVVPGASGAWVRGGVSWRSLQYPSVGPGPRSDQAQLMREISALEPYHFASYYGTGSNPPIWLDSIPSPRIWHLLAEAQRLGIAFVQHRNPAAVRLLTEPAELAVELTRDAGLLVEPVITVAGARFSSGEAIVVGDPPHGVVVTGGASAGGGEAIGEIWLAPLSRPVDAATATLVNRHRLRVPAGDEERFLTRYYPALRRRATVVTRDPDLELPEPEPPVLVLHVTPDAGERLELRWHWRYRIAGIDRSEPLWPAPFDAGDRRETEIEAVTVKSVTAAVEAAGAEALLEPTTDAQRLAPLTWLDGLTAVRFASEVLPRLRAVPGVEVEVAGDLPDYREVSGELVVTIAGDDDPADSDWFDLSVTVEVGGHLVPFAALFAALATGQDYVVFDDGYWLPLLDEQFQRLAQLIKEARDLNEADPDPARLRLSRYQTDMWSELEQLGVISGQAAEWQSAVAALRDVPALPAPALPTGLRAQLRPYQEAGFAWLAFLHDHRLGGILADDMGLGKTVQTIALMLHAKESGTVEPFLVVAPTSVVFNWAAECERFAPGLTVRTITETTRRRRRPIAEVANGADVVVTSYALLRLDEDEYAAQQWAGLILDEAQFVKNRSSRGYASARKIPARFRLAVTGTPLENNLMELWSLLSIAAPGLFPDPKRFEAHYRKPIETGRDPALLGQLRRRVAPLMLRRTKQEVADDLPDKQEQVVELPLNPKQRRIYDTHLQRERQKVLGLLGDLDRNRFEIFRSLTLLRQLTLDVGLVDDSYVGVPSTKLDALMELLVEIVDEGHRVLVFSQFTRFLEQARQRIEAAGIDHAYLDGGTTKRAEVIERFRTGGAPVFLISLKAGGFGLNLTEADYCVLLDPWWNPAAEAQAIDRTHRIGQTRTVMVYRLVAKDTIEDKVMALKARKAALFASVMSGGGTGDAALTAADIRQILD